MRDDFLFSEGKNFVERNCFVCQAKNDHFPQKCPTAHYIPDTKQFLNQYNNNLIQIRQANFNRNPRRIIFNSRYERENVQNTIAVYRENSHNIYYICEYIEKHLFEDFSDESDRSGYSYLNLDDSNSDNGIPSTMQINQNSQNYNIDTFTPSKR